MSTLLAENERIYRYEVPVDDRWHEIATLGVPLHVGCVRDIDVVEFWARWDPASAALAIRTWFRVIGTGQPVPAVATYRGTAVARATGASPLVWHLISSTDDPGATP